MIWIGIALLGLPFAERRDEERTLAGRLLPDLSLEILDSCLKQSDLTLQLFHSPLQHLAPAPLIG